MKYKYTDNIAGVILEKINILEVINSYLPLKKSGRNHKALCPFHSEKTPSFIVSEEKQLFHCFGCGEAGSALSFVMKMENLDFIDAIEYIADKYNIDLEEFKNEKFSKEELLITEQIYEINKMAANGFYNYLKNDKEATKYLLNRKISPETMKKFGLGFAPDQWDYIYKNLIKKYDEKVLLKAGLIIKKEKNDGYYDRFRNRIIFPILDIRGRVIGFGGRVTDDAMPKYLNSPDTPVFNKSFNLYGMNYAKNNLGDKKKLIVVEGYMDVISLYDKGIKNVVATLGTSLTQGHGKLMERYSDEVILLYDSDVAGIKATRRAIEILNAFSMKIKVLTLPDRMDPDEYIVKFGKDSLIELIDSAKDAIEYMLDFYRVDLNFEMKSDLIEYVNRIKFVFDVIKNPIEYELYIKKVANETNLSTENLMKELKKKNIVINENKVEDKVKLNLKELKLYIRLFEILINERKYLIPLFNKYKINEVNDSVFVNIANYIFSNEEIKIEDTYELLSIDEIQLLQKIISNGDYIPVKNGKREVEKIYLDIISNDIKRTISKLKKGKETSLSNNNRESDECNDEFANELYVLNSRLMNINKMKELERRESFDKSK